MVDLVGVGAVLGGLGSIFGGSKPEGVQYPSFKTVKNTTRASLRGTVQEARRNGLHPLAALGHSVASPVASVTSSGPSVGERIAGAGAALSQLGQGRLAQRVADAEIAMTEAQTKVYEMQALQLAREASAAMRMGPGGPGNYGSPEETTGVKEVPLVQRHERPGGPAVDVAAGPDISEVIMGGAIDLVGEARERAEAYKMSEVAAAEILSRNGGKKIEWDPRFGKQPPGWVGWDAQRRLAWVIRNAKKNYDRPASSYPSMNKKLTRRGTR